MEKLGYSGAAREALDNAARLKGLQPPSASAAATSPESDRTPEGGPTERSLSDLLRVRQVVIFAGAGISIPPPAGLPDWNTLRDQLVRVCARGEPALLRHLPSLTEMPMIAREGSKGVTPELVMSRIEALYPGYAAIFGSLKEGEPNANHRYIARMAAAGYCNIIVTTNFDTYIERALDEAGVSYQTFIDQLEDFPYYYPATDGVQVLKIHGCISAPHSITATVEREAAGLAPSIRRALIQLLPDYVFAFWGYSGADLKIGLDYLGMASLRDVARGFFWSFHATGARKEEPSPEVRELAALYASRAIIGHNLFPAAFDELLPESLRPKKAAITDRELESWKQQKTERLVASLDNWAEKAVSPAGAALIYGSLLHHKGDAAAAQVLYERAAAGSNDTVEHLKAAVALGNLALERGDDAAAMDYFQRLPEELEGPLLEDGLAALQGMAEVYARRGDYLQTGSWLDMGITIAQSHRLYRTQTLLERRLAEAFVRWGRVKQARELYQNVLETMRANGLENERAEALLAYAELLADLEQTDSALAQVDRALHIARTLGNAPLLRRSRLAHCQYAPDEPDTTLDALAAEAVAATDAVALGEVAALRAQRAANRDDRVAARKEWVSALASLAGRDQRAWSAVCHTWGLWQVEWGATDTGLALLDTAIQGYREAGAKADEAAAHEVVGTILLNSGGDSGRMSEHLEAAYWLLRRAGADSSGRVLAFLAAAYRDPKTWDDYCQGIDDPIVGETPRPPTVDDLVTAQTRLFVAVVGAAQRAHDSRDYTTAISRFSAAFALADRIGSDPLRMETLLSRAHSRRALGLVDAAFADYREARNLAADNQDTRSLMVSRYGMGWCFAQKGDLESATKLWDEATRLASTQHFLRKLIDYAYAVGHVLAKPRPEDSVRFLRQAQLAAQRLGDNERLAQIYEAWSIALAQQPGKNKEAADTLESAAKLYRRTGDLNAAIECLRRAASLAAAGGLWEQAMTLLEQAVGVLLLTGDPGAHPSCSSLLAELARVDANHDPSATVSPALVRLEYIDGRVADYYLQLAAQRLQMPAEIKNSTRIGRILEHHQGSWARALWFIYKTAYEELHEIKLLESAMRNAEVYLEGVETLAALEPLGAAYAAAGRAKEARTTYRRAVGLAAEIDDDKAQLRALTALAELYRAEGAHDAARCTYLQARLVAEQLRDRAALGAIAQALGK